MVLDEETYEMIDEYLQSGVKVFKQMHEEYGEDFYNDFDEYFDEFQQRTYDLTEEVPDDMLESFKDMFMKDLNEKLDGETTPIATAGRDYEDKLEYTIRVFDTKAILHKRGRRIEWGSNTPINAQSIINDVVYN